MPEQIFQAWGGDVERAWFQSSPRSPALLAGGPPLWRWRGSGDQGVWWEAGVEKVFSAQEGLGLLRSALGALPGRRPGVGGNHWHVDDMMPAALGYFGYESGRLFEEGLKGKAPRRALPDFWWWLPSQFVKFQEGKVTAWGLGATRREAKERLESLWALGLGCVEKQRRSGPSPSPSPTRGEGLPLQANKIKPLGRPQDRLAYERGVRRIKTLIAQGDIYQANLVRAISTHLPENFSAPLFFHQMVERHPAPYGVLLSFPAFDILSASPELLLRVEGRRVYTRPIAGTAPRGATPAQERRWRRFLTRSGKNRAEHIMLVDLARNDLGRVCRPGTVRVSERLSLERHPTVTHIVSQVEGQLERDQDGLSALAALFPGGTITGCPKIRSVAVLKDLEGSARGIHFGAAGWIGSGGRMELNLLIRTFVRQGRKLTLKVGSGIVADSDPRSEYEETVQKARGLLHLAGGAL